MRDFTNLKHLGPAQMMVLEVVKDFYSKQDLEDLRKLLLDFNDRKLQQHLDEIVAHKGYTEADFEKMLNSHDRRAHSGQSASLVS